MGDLKINYNKAFTTKYSRDFYRGTSFHYAGAWEVGQHYTCDEFNVDFIVCDQVLLACSKSHTSTKKNKPDTSKLVRSEDGNIIGINSPYWDFVLSGLGANIDIAKYLIDNDIILSKDKTEEYIAELSFNVDGLRVKFEHDIDDLNNDITHRYTSAITQTAEEIRSDMSENITDLRTGLTEDYDSKINQTAREINATVTANKEDADGKIERLGSELSITAEEIRSTVSAEVEDLNGTIENRYSEINQTADEIRSTVESNKRDAEAADERLSSTISQTAESITSTVNAYKEELDGTISDNYSELKQTANEISSTVAANKTELEGTIEERYSQMRQTADEISATVTANKQELDGTIDARYSELKQTADEISSTIESNKTDLEGQLEQNYSQLSQRADQITATVAQNKTDAEGLINSKYSEISQRADSIVATVAQNKTDLENVLEKQYSELKMTADEIAITVANNKTDLEGNINTKFSEISQRADQISARVEEVNDLSNGALEEKYAELKLTTDEISSTVVANKQAADLTAEALSSSISQTATQIRSEVSREVDNLTGEINQAKSSITQTADEITAKVEAYKTELDGTINSNYSELSQTAEAITATVAANKVANDEALGVLEEDLNTKITQTAEAITQEANARVTREGEIVEEYTTKFQQTAEAITSEVSARETSEAGIIADYESQITQTAEQIRSEVTAAVEDINGDISDTRSSITQTASQIRSEVAAHVETLEGSISDTNSTITQTASAIRSEVASHVEDLEGAISDTNSSITQTASDIRSEVNTQVTDINGKITAANTAITQNANAITLRAEEISDLSDRVDSFETSVGNQFASNAKLLQSLQNQVDGAIETYYENYEPTLQNAPASTWSTNEIKENHVGDLFYDKNTGYSYRFFNDNGTYKWSRILDSDITTALANAAKAQSTADGKMTIFYTQPSTYCKGDMWIMENGSDECIIKKSKEDRVNNYVSTDWEEVTDVANITKIAASFAVMADMIASEVGEYTQGNNLVPNSLYSKILQSRDQISLRIGTAKSEAIADADGKFDAVKDSIRDTGIDIEHKKVTITADNFVLQGNDASHNKALELVYDSAGNPRISAANLQVEGVFSTSAWEDQKSSVLGTAASDATSKANAAQSAAEATAAADATSKTDAAILAAAADATSKANSAQSNAIATAAADATTKANAAEKNAKDYAKDLDDATRTYVDSTDYFTSKILPDVQTAINAKAQDLIDNQIDSANDAALAAQIVANAAQSTANTAVADAAAADQKAVAAQQAADDANDLLEDWASDNIISPTEKRALAQQLNDINQEKVDVLADADKYALSESDKNAYNTAYTKAKAALEYHSNVNSDPENITIITDTSDNRCYANIAAYYTARTTILNTIAIAAKKVATDAQAAADAAQTTANTANAAAAAADAKAVQAQTDANTANSKLTDWASDGKISPVEKTALYQQYLDVQQEKAEIDADIERYNISDSDKATFNNAYNAAITAFKRYFPPTAAMNATTDKASDYDNIGAYYNARAVILGIIAGKVKSEIHEVDYLKDALIEENTTIAGGLILSTLIQLGSSSQESWQVYSGINGSYQGPTSIAAWYGGQMKDKGLSAYANDSTAAKSLFRMDGSGYLANGKITWDTAGNASFNGAITATSLTLGNDVSIAVQKVSGLSAVATSGSYADLSNIPDLSGFLTANSEIFNNIQGQIDAKAQTWYQDTDPSSQWTDDATKKEHVGDIWMDTSSNGGKRTKIYQKNGNSYTWVNQEVPEIVNTAIAAKANIYVTLPSSAKDGDLLIPTSDIGTTYKAGKVYRYANNAWAEVAYSDDSELTRFLEETYVDDKDYILQQVDQKADTYYGTQPYGNKTNVIESNEDNAHVGDIWYDATNSKTYIYRKVANGSDKWNYTWTEIDGVPDTVFDRIDGIASIYVTKPSNPNPGDLLIPNSDITEGNITYKAGKVYKYNGSSWVEINYTDDSGLTAFINGDYATDLQDIENQIDKKADTWYQVSDPASATGWVAANHVGDLWYKTTDNTTWYYKDNGGSASPRYSWVQQNVPTAVFNSINGKASIYVDPTNIVTSTLKEGDLLIPNTTSGNYIAGKCYKWNGSSWVGLDYTDNTTVSNTITTRLSDSLSAYTPTNQLATQFSTYLGNNNYKPYTELTNEGFVKTNVGLGSQSGNSYFIVDPNGLLTANNAIISGQITATSGAIGGILIGNNGIASSNGNFSVTSSGALTAVNASLSGEINATSGYIGALKIDSAGLSVRSGSTDIGYIGAPYGNEDIILSVGIPVNGTPEDGLFKIDASGAMYSVGGQIGPLEIHSNFLGVDVGEWDGVCIYKDHIIISDETNVCYIYADKIQFQTPLGTSYFDYNGFHYNAY